MENAKAGAVSLRPEDMALIDGAADRHLGALMS
jgi:hypothetical protein